MEELILIEGFLCLVWNLAKKKPWRIFKHTYPIVSVALSDTLCLSGGQNGKIKVFTLLEGKLLKVKEINSKLFTKQFSSIGFRQLLHIKAR